MKRQKRRLILAILQALVVFFCFYCMIKTSENNKNINKAIGRYENKSKVMRCSGITLENGKEVEIVCGESAMKIADSYLYTQEEVCEIIILAREQAKIQGYIFERSTTSLIGEFRLHQIAYRMGIERNSSKDLDLDYGEDRRWYVNVLSGIFGWCGI